jgi:putative tryptophan/tyrosine transport system substrate-binding protein
MQFDQLKRRKFITLLGGAAATWPLTVRAQTKLPTVGFLGSAPESAQGQRLAALVRRLRELGWIDGRTVTIEVRWTEGRNEQFAEVAGEFVRLKVDVIVTSGTPPVQAALRATPVIPIVFAAAGDPVGNGLVTSLSHPGGNVTGNSVLSTDLAAKRLQLLREVVPGLGKLAIMGNVGNPLALSEIREVQHAAGALGLEAKTLEINRSEDITPALLEVRADALYVAFDALTDAHQVRINTLALGRRLPTMHSLREHVATGGLMSYGPNFLDLFRRAAEYVDKILRGAKPADLPVEQPTKFDLIINLTTAKALGLKIPESFLLRADEVIE